MDLTLIPEEENEFTELDFTLNGFHKQKVFSGPLAYAQLLSRLLVMRRGTNPSFPDAGIGLGSYRFKDIDSNIGGELKEKILAQVDQFIPNMQMTELNISKTKYKGDWILFINFSIPKYRSEATIGFLQKNGNIISSNINVEKQHLIDTNGSD